MKTKDIFIRAKFGKGKKAHIKEYRFKTRKGARRFAIMFLWYNPHCTSYIIIGK